MSTHSPLSSPWLISFKISSATTPNSPRTPRPTNTQRRRPSPLPTPTPPTPFHVEKSSVTFDDPTKTLQINYKMANVAEASLKQAYLVKEQHQFFDPAAGFIDLSACGIHHVQMQATVAPPADVSLTYEI